MREHGEGPRPPGRSRVSLLLGLLAAFEALVIVVLLMRPAAGVERETPARTAESGGPAGQVAPTDLPEPRVLSGVERATDDPNSLRQVSPEPLAAAPHAAPAVGLVLCGTVTVDDGLPITDAFARVEIDDPRTEFTVPVVRGAYSLAGLIPGTYTVSAHVQSCRSPVLEVVLDAARPIERLDLRLERMPSVFVRIRTPDGRPLLELFDESGLPGSLRPLATLQPPGKELAEETRTPAQSWFVRRQIESSDPVRAELQAGDWDGVLSLQAPLPVAVSLVWSQRVLETQMVATPGAGASFVVDLDTLRRELSVVRVRVVDAQSGAPLAGALAQIESDFLRGDDTGVFVFDDVPPGPHQLHVHPPGSWYGVSDSLAIVGTNDATHGDALLRFESRAGDSLDLGEARLLRTVVVSGRLTDGSGRPLGDDVVATSLEADIDPQSRSRRVILKPNPNDGSFSAHLVPGRWRFAVGYVSPESPGSLTVDVRGDLEGLALMGNAR